jgi:hypothetical protein
MTSASPIPAVAVKDAARVVAMNPADERSEVLELFTFRQMVSAAHRHFCMNHVMQHWIQRTEVSMTAVGGKGWPILLLER